MLQDQIQSLARTPDPIIVEKLPSLKIYILHYAFSWIERYWRMDAGVPYPPLDPQPYKIPPDIEERLEMYIGLLSLKELKNRVVVFLKSFPTLKPTKENLLYHLMTALDPWTPPPLSENPGPAPALEIEKQKPKRINPTLKKKTTARGLKWRLDPRWDKLTPSDIAVFTVLLIRAIWPKKPNKWPWAFAGVGTWIKGKGEIQSKLSKQTGFKCAQLRRALRHLQSFGMIKKIIRGSTGSGVSKFLVFFTPEMSKAYTAIAKNKKRIPSQQKRDSTMS